MRTASLMPGSWRCTRGALWKHRVTELQKRGEHMQRIPSCCDFCGDSNNLREYQAERAGINWFACEDCARLVDAEHWEELIEHSLAAYRQIRPIPDGEEPTLRQHVEQLVHASRSFRLVHA